MITHQDNQFIYNGIAAVPCPSGMRIDSANSYDDSLQFVSPDGKLRLCIEFFSSSKRQRS